MNREVKVFFHIICPIHGEHYGYEIHSIRKNTNPHRPGSYGLPATCCECDWDRGKYPGHRRPKPIVEVLTEEEYYRIVGTDDEQQEARELYNEREKQARAGQLELFS